MRWGENSTDEMGSLLLNVLPKHAGDIDPLHAGTIVYVLTPVPLVGNRPLLVSSGVVDGASAQPGAVTPGKIVVLYGAGIGPADPGRVHPAGGGGISTSLGGTQVLFDGVPAPMLYASADRWRRSCRTQWIGKQGTQVQVRERHTHSDSVALPVTPVAPSIFSVNLSGHFGLVRELAQHRAERLLHFRQLRLVGVEVRGFLRFRLELLQQLLLFGLRPFQLGLLRVPHQEIRPRDDGDHEDQADRAEPERQRPAARIVGVELADLVEDAHRRAPLGPFGACATC